ncbi:hypothetical protein MMC28_004773, partial [Mycoblastus sanguinarius]|nr:hypothetical protein [Mycoblastus sanguinarius]
MFEKDDGSPFEDWKDKNVRIEWDTGTLRPHQSQTILQRSRSQPNLPKPIHPDPPISTGPSWHHAEEPIQTSLATC